MGNPKGANAERELIHLFWKGGWAATRVAGSGSSSYPSPDIVAGNAARKVAIECKAVKGKQKYLAKEQVAALVQFASRFGAEPWIGVRFNNEPWYFVAVDDLGDTGKHASVTRDLARKKGIILEELIGPQTVAIP
ncbi:MAG TPA: Holliday junction resolvase Hjc [Candidatus Nanoarchaeia archaeon]|nr:Holliday junction resolvase Hjc [Candidatus Nanoarchaeia archaeon]